MATCTTMLENHKMDKENPLLLDATVDNKHERPDTISETLYAIIFSHKANHATVYWLTELIRSRHQEGGAELQVKVTPGIREKDLILHISAETSRLLEMAEVLRIRKQDKEGFMREFSIKELEMFLSNDIGPDDLLTTSEKQRIVLHCIESLHVSDKESLCGYPQVKLYPGQSVIQVCRNHNIICDMFPLHDRGEMNKLEKEWYTFIFNKPLDGIRNYFGESLAFYFAFLQFYTMALVPPAILGILQCLLPVTVSYIGMCFAIFNLVGLTLFLELWKRWSNKLAYIWGTLGIIRIHQPRLTFRGKEMREDPVTRKPMPYYPSQSRLLKVYCVSLPIVLICLAGAIWITSVFVNLEKQVISAFGKQDDLFGSMVVHIPSVTHIVFIIILNLMYRRLATWLTEWENHRTQESYDSYRIVKLILFEFVNNFIGMFYTAFWIQDMDLLRSQVNCALLVNLVITNIQEHLLPLVQYRVSKRQALIDIGKQGESSDQVERVILESQRIPFEDSFDDYLELFVQYGHVFLFSPVIPLAAFLALLHNVVEIPADVFKLFKSYQRPTPRTAQGIGIWLMAFEVMGAIAVMTNCALLGMSPVIRSLAPSASTAEWILIVVIAEHVILGLKFAIAYLIPDIPKSVNMALQRTAYESQEALRQQQKKTGTDLLIHRLRSSHGSARHHVKKE